MSSAKTPRTAKVSVTEKSVDLSILKFTQQLLKTQEQWVKNVTDHKTFLEDELTNQTNQIDYNKNLIHELDLEYENHKKDKEIKLKLFIDEYKDTAIQDFLKDQNKMSIDIDEYKKLVASSELLVEQHKKELEDTLSKEKAKNKQSMEYVTKTLELQKIADVAKVTAQLDTKTEQIKFLYETIESLKKDLNAQRELTKDVALAAASSGQRFQQQSTNQLCK